MKDLGAFCMNPYSDAKISLNRKQAYGEDSIHRIAVQNTNQQFDELLTLTIAVQEDLFGNISNLETLKAVREARTASVNKIIAKFKRRNTRLNSYLISLETELLPVYQEFFPQGVQVFTREITKENIELRMEEMITSITNNTSTAGGPAVLQEYQDFLANYKKARGEQLTKAGEISNTISHRKSAEERWDEQMFSNLLYFANLCHNKPGKLSQYLNAALLKAYTHHTTSQTGHVKGRLTDSNGHPLYNVIVQVKGRKLSRAHTGVNGDYTTRPLPVGKWRIEYRKGKRSVLKDIEIAEGETIELNVVL